MANSLDDDITKTLNDTVDLYDAYTKNLSESTDVNSVSETAKETLRKATEELMEMCDKIVKKCSNQNEKLKTIAARLPYLISQYQKLTEHRDRVDRFKKLYKKLKALLRINDKRLTDDLDVVVETPANRDRKTTTEDKDAAPVANKGRNVKPQTKKQATYAIKKTMSTPHSSTRTDPKQLQAIREPTPTMSQIKARDRRWKKDDEYEIEKKRVRAIKTPRPTKSEAERRRAYISGTSNETPVQAKQGLKSNSPPSDTFAQRESNPVQCRDKDTEVPIDEFSADKSQPKVAIALDSTGKIPTAPDKKKRKMDSKKRQRTRSRSLNQLWTTNPSVLRAQREPDNSNFQSDTLRIANLQSFTRPSDTSGNDRQELDTDLNAVRETRSSFTSNTLAIEENSQDYNISEDNVPVHYPAEDQHEHSTDAVREADLLYPSDTLKERSIIELEDALFDDDNLKAEREELPRSQTQDPTIREDNIAFPTSKTGNRRNRQQKKGSTKDKRSRQRRTEPRDLWAKRERGYTHGQGQGSTTGASKVDMPFDSIPVKVEEGKRSDGSATSYDIIYEKKRSKSKRNRTTDFQSSAHHAIMDKIPQRGKRSDETNAGLSNSIFDSSQNQQSAVKGKSNKPNKRSKNRSNRKSKARQQQTPNANRSRPRVSIASDSQTGLHSYFEDDPISMKVRVRTNGGSNGYSGDGVSRMWYWISLVSMILLITQLLIGLPPISQTFRSALVNHNQRTNEAAREAESTLERIWSNLHTKQ